MRAGISVSCTGHCEWPGQSLTLDLSPSSFLRCLWSCPRAPLGQMCLQSVPLSVAHHDLFFLFLLHVKVTT